MTAKSISTHVAAVLAQMENVQALTRDQQAQIVDDLYAIMEAKQRGAIIIDLPYPETDRLTPIAAKYVSALKPSDVLDDPPSSFRG